MKNEIHAQYSLDVIKECRRRKESLDNALIGILDEQKGSIQYFDAMNCDVERLQDWDGDYWIVKDRKNMCITKIKVTFTGLIAKNEPFIYIKLKEQGGQINERCNINRKTY